jgi:hypothetical protein
LGRNALLSIHRIGIIYEQIEAGEKSKGHVENNVNMTGCPTGIESLLFFSLFK